MSFSLHLPRPRQGSTRSFGNRGEEKIKARLVDDAWNALYNSNELVGFSAADLRRIITQCVERVCESNGILGSKRLLEKVLFQVRIELSCGRTPREPPKSCPLLLHEAQSQTPFISEKMKQDEYAQLAWLDSRVHDKEEKIRQRQKAQRCADARQALKDFQVEKEQLLRKEEEWVKKEAAQRERVQKMREEERLRRERAWQDRNRVIGEQNRVALQEQIERKKRVAKAEKERDKRFLEESLAWQEKQLLDQEAALKRFQEPISAEDVAEVEAHIQSSNFKSKAEEYRHRRMVENMQRRRRMLQTLRTQVRGIEERKMQEKQEEYAFRRQMKQRLAMEEQAFAHEIERKSQLTAEYCKELKIQIEMDKLRNPLGMTQTERDMNKPLLDKVEQNVREWRGDAMPAEDLETASKQASYGHDEKRYPLLSPAMRSIC